MSLSEHSFEDEFPTEEEALLAPVIWAEVWAFAGQAGNEYILPAANNLCLAIKYPDSQWITSGVRNTRDILVAEVTERIPNISVEALEYVGDYVFRVIGYYSRNPQFLHED